MKPKLNNPKSAKKFFKRKLAYTAGPIEIRDWLESNEQFNLIDVRSTDDFEKEHISGATNLPRGKWDSLAGLQGDRLNVVYCYSRDCQLAARACREFAAEGFSVMEMEGGIAAWREHDFDLDREPVDVPGPNLNLRDSEVSSVAH